MNPVSILLVDDDLEHRDAYTIILKGWGYEVTLAKDGIQAAIMASRRKFDLILMDVRMDGLDGLEALAFIKNGELSISIPEVKGDSLNLQTPVIMLTGFGTVGDAVQAMKDGAYDFLIKAELDNDVLKLKLENALDHHRLQEQKQAGLIGEPNLIVGRSQVFQKVLETIDKIAANDSSVLITGESGVGKEVIARLIWQKSRRKDRAFATCNCTAVSKETVEDTLFGHRKGAFTGAVGDRQGILKSADGGTVFLDEIAETTQEFQTKLLRTLQEGEIQPLGSDRVDKVDIRFLAATNKDLEKEIVDKRFREDLFYRFTFHVRIPSLRERPEDLPDLANYYLNRFALNNGRSVSGLSPKALSAIMAYHWPGNVRELQNAMEWAVIMMDGQELTERDLPQRVTQSSAAPGVKPEGDRSPLSLDEAERKAVEEALEYTGGVKEKASKILGMTRKTLLSKIRKHNLVKFMPSNEEDTEEED
jgi:two-component system response regulator HydG